MVSAIRLGADTQIHTQMPAGLNISAHQEKQEEEKGEEKEERGGGGMALHDRVQRASLAF